MKDKNIFEGLFAYILELESLRPPISVFLTPYSRGTLFEFLFKRNKKIHFIKNNPELHQKIQNELDPYFKKMVKISLKDVIIFFSSILFTAFIIAIIAVISELYPNNIVTTILIWFCLSCFLLFQFWTYTKRKRILGEKYDETIKKSVQELIDYGNNYIKENNLNYEYYPIKLKHNNYKNLKYEEKGKYYYIGYFKQ